MERCESEIMGNEMVLVHIEFANNLLLYFINKVTIINVTNINK
jgi:hypothetical protein